MKTGLFSIAASLSACLLAAAAPIESKSLDPQESPPSYQVLEDGESLRLISLRLYGHSKRWQDIAARNGLQDPYLIRTGQVLLLPDSPTIEKRDGDLLVLNFWRKKLGLSEMASIEAIPQKPVIALKPVEPIQVEPVIEAPKAPPVLPQALHQEVKQGNFEKAFDELAAAPKESNKALQKKIAEQDQRIVWVEGKTAEIIYMTMKGASIPATIDFDQAPPSLLSIEEMERKRGKDITCAREPQVSLDRTWIRDESGQIQFRVRCMGFIRADSAQYLVKNEVPTVIRDSEQENVESFEVASRSPASIEKPTTVLDDRPFQSGIQMLKEGKITTAFSEFQARSQETVAKPENSRVVWTEGIAAEVIYKSMSAVPMQKARVDFDRTPAGQYTFDQLERKIGRDVTCAREPKLTEDKKDYVRDPKNQIQFRIRCLGYIRESDADTAAN
ncbi:MAG: LysM peptidoglycan-binding domain-containing protein [Bdellovibrionales bacterium]|nr:LysM peptidoglycan-binding domain-containing protein [Bdellovibrionales bacterium]